MTGNNQNKCATVSIVKVNDYDYNKVYSALEKCLDLIGFPGKTVKQNSKVFVKINHLSPPSPPEKGIVTHPVFVKAVLDLLKSSGVSITVGDDIDHDGEDGFTISGIRQVCEEAEVELVNLREGGFTEINYDGLILNKLYISKIALDADLIINLPKLKTHSLTVFTGGIKNMYGTIPKGYRTRFHYDYMKIEDFSGMLVDVFSVVKPYVTIMDGVTAMEGEGPGSGSLRNLGIILASKDTVALDTVASRIIGLEPLNIITTRYAYERGLGIGNLEDIDVVGETITDISVSDYKHPANYSSAVVSSMPAFLSKFLLNQMVVRPVVIEQSCIGCFECKRICPAGAVLEIDNKAEIDYSVCIHCLCCHETCRFNAIIPKRTIIGNFMNFAADTLRKVV